MSRHATAIAGTEVDVNEKEQSEEYYAQLSEHRSRGDANESNAEGMIYPVGEPIERTGRFVVDIPEDEETPG